ncbi:hypothetical protein BK127_11990 [Paenibacillus sp. FSL H7-0331]|nr:hypothetical protein BK127_11990 [Paenibacillus sp. FSL H7-0331]
MWQIAFTLALVIEYWYYFAVTTLLIIFVISYNILRKKKRLQIHRKYRKTGVLDAKARKEAP